MDMELISKIDECIMSMNDKQKSIARSLVIDNRYNIFVGSNDVLFIKDVISRLTYDFVIYVKSKCNC